MSRRWNDQAENVRAISEAVQEAIEEAACINRRIEDQPDGGVHDAGVEDAAVDASMDGGVARNIFPLPPGYNYKETGMADVGNKWSLYRMCF